MAELLPVVEEACAVGVLLIRRGALFATGLRWYEYHAAEHLRELQVSFTCSDVADLNVRLTHGC